jgi:hypothetical protein
MCFDPDRCRAKKFKSIFTVLPSTTRFTRHITPSASSSASQSLPTNKAKLNTVEHPDGEYLAMRILYDLNHNMSLGYAIGGQILSFLKPDPS